MNAFFQKQEVKDRIKEILIKHGAQYIFEDRNWDDFIRFLSSKEASIGDLRFIDHIYESYFQEEDMDLNAAIAELSLFFYKHKSDLGDYFRVKYLSEVGKRLKNNNSLSSFIAFMAIRPKAYDQRIFTISLVNPYTFQTQPLIAIPSELVYSAATCISPTWTPDGKSVLFSSLYRGGDSCGIYKADLLKNRIEYITGAKNRIYQDLRLSPEGGYLAYTYVGEDRYKRVGFMIMKDGRTRRVDIPFVEGLSCRHPIWKNESQLYFQYSKIKGSGSGVMLVDVGNLKVIDDAVAEMHLPSRSNRYVLIIPADKTYLVWRIKDQKTGFETRIEGTLKEKIYGGGIGFNLDNPPSWAPDDEKIVFIRGKDIQGDEEIKSIYIYDAETVEEVRLPIDYALQPTWSPASNIDWNFEPIGMTKIGQRGVGCFIATAACRSDDVSEVIFLCNFRDHYLSKSYWGRTFIRLYYFLSPPIANSIARSERLSRFTRKFFIKPLVRFLRTLLEN